MNTLEWIVLVVAIAAALLLLAMFARIRRRRAHLQEQFGPEYQRAVADQGIGGGEKRLSEIESERNELEIRTTCHPQPVIATWTSGARRRRGSSAIRAMRLALPRRSSFARSRSVATRTRTTTSGSPHSSRSTTPTWRTAIATVTRCSRASTAAESTENLRKAMLDFRSVLEDVVVVRSRTAA